MHSAKTGGIVRGSLFAAVQHYHYEQRWLSNGTQKSHISTIRWRKRFGHPNGDWAVGAIPTKASTEDGIIADFSKLCPKHFKVGEAEPNEESKHWRKLL